ncbi:MAG: metal ABC transporter permease [Hyphomicrobiales bacterium]
MLDDFLVRALLAGLGLAVVTGPLGCFVVWRRMSYFGDAMAHAALLGVALSLLLQINTALAVFAVALVAALLVLALEARSALAADAALGLLSHGALAAGLIALAAMTWLRIDIMSLLFGDLLAVTRSDLVILYGGGALVLALLFWIWRPLLAATVSFDIAAAEGLRPRQAQVVFMVLLAAVVAVAIKIVGAMLITAMLVVPAAAARRLSAGPVQMAVLSALAGAIAVCVGLWGSFTWDTPAGPSVVAAASLLFALGLVLPPRTTTHGPDGEHDHGSH